MIDLSDFTQAELRVFRASSEYYSVAEVADACGYAYRTVLNMMPKIYAKLGAKNFTQVVAIAVQYYGVD